MHHLRALLALAAAAGLTVAGCNGEVGVDDDDATDDDSTDDDDTGDDDSTDDDADSADADDSADDDDTTDPDPYLQPAVYVTPLTLEPGGTATVHYYGELAQEDDLTLHYGFNGWNEVQGVTGLIEIDEPGNITWYGQVEMAPVLDGFEVTVDLPTDGRALHFAFFTTDGEDETWDNNDEQDFHQSILFPYIGPFLTWTEQTPPDQGVVISYETSVPCRGTLEYGTTASLGTSIVGDEASRMHHVVLDGLSPDTEYHYRVHDSADHVSETFTFRTAPAAADAFRFGVLSDMQDTGEVNRWGDVAEELHDAHTDVAFLVLPGDLTASDGPGSWWTFFDRGRELFRGTVMMPVPGNHDTPGHGHDEDTSSFEGYFPLPAAAGVDVAYRFDYGNASFLAFSSEILSEFAPGGDQYGWADDELADIAATGAADWVFAYWHDPPYNAGIRHAEAQQEARDLTQLFDGLVDWVLCGHEHLYQRTLPLLYEAQLAPGDYGNAPGDGVGYIVTPPAGQGPGIAVIPPDAPEAPRRDRLAYPALAADQVEVPSENGFVIVSVDGSTILIEAYGMGDHDTFVPAHVVDDIGYTK